NYFKIAWRNLFRNKVYSMINIFGLAVGITTCTLITMYVMDETSYDKHHKEGERIYRIASDTKGEKWVSTAAPYAAALKKDFPEVEQQTRLLRMPGVDKFLLEYEPSKKQFFETNGYYVDSTFFSMFSYDFKYGDKNTAFDQPNTIVISAAMAEKFFGKDNPINKVVKVGLPFGETNYTIKGVLKTQVFKSHIPDGFFLNMNNSDVGQWVKAQANWASNNVFHTYIKLHAGTNPKTFEAKLPAFLNRNGGADFKAWGLTKTLFLQPLKDIYLHSNYGFEIAPNGNIQYLYIFSSIAAFLLLIACINFMNLSTARSEKRAKEVGVRKVVGAVKSMLIGQFLGESLLLSFLALIISLAFIKLFIPLFNQLTGKSLSLTEHPQIFAWLLLITVATGLLAGFYPAFYLSSFKPISVLKGKLKTNISASFIRKGLVVFQFSISIVLILGAILIGKQLDYVSNQNLGFSKSQKIVLPLQTKEAAVSLTVLKNDLAANPQVISSAMGSTYPGIENIQDMLFYGEGKSAKDNIDIVTAYIDNDYVKTLGIQILRGRGFSKEFTADSNALVLNETAVKKLGYTTDNAVGRNAYFEFHDKKYSMNIIGVVKDYHFEGLQQEIKPFTLSQSPFFSAANSYLIVDIKSNDYASVLSLIEKSWKRINPNSPFEYTFLDKDFQRNYEKEQRTSALIKYSALIAIVIACLGLFGLATFTAEQRTKEIGIRKVLGASVFGITSLLSKDFIKLILLSIFIASPLAWLAMNKWLQNFSYKTSISWWMFAVTGLLSVLIAIVTISFQAIKAALANPVKSLRTE
ncbi:MAG TPA: ABC transporter permease, partial [Chitinophagaceae bacterium]|nr:ABC transporter permease [Chitinophagaceae bacterium]